MKISKKGLKIILETINEFITNNIEEYKTIIESGKPPDIWTDEETEIFDKWTEFSIYLQEKIENLFD